MNAKLRLLPLLVGFFLSSVPAPAQTPEMLAHFDYNKNAPLGTREIGVEKRGDVSIHDITYVSPKGGVVPAYLVVPKGKGPFAAVVWGHWYWGNSLMRNRNQFLDEAVALAPAGVVSLLTDGPIARPGHVENNEPLNEQQITDLVQQVIDMRRGVDLLLARKVDPKRIAYVGHSYNAVVGAFLSGIDRRFKAFVLMAATMSDEVSLKTPEYQEYRQKVGPEKFDAFMAKYTWWTDQGKYVSHAAPAVVFLQYATKENFITPERAGLYAAVVSEPKRFKLYEAAHALNAEARRDRIAFLTEQLKLKPLSPAVIASIPDLYQPPTQN